MVTLKALDDLVTGSNEIAAILNLFTAQGFEFSDLVVEIDRGLFSPTGDITAMIYHGSKFKVDDGVAVSVLVGSFIVNGDMMMPMMRVGGEGWPDYEILIFQDKASWNVQTYNAPHTPKWFKTAVATVTGNVSSIDIIGAHEFKTDDGLMLISTVAAVLKTCLPKREG